MRPGTNGGMPVRAPAFDAVNGTAAASFIGATLAGWSINEWAAAAALAYTLLLIADKAWTLWKRWRESRK